MLRFLVVLLLVAVIPNCLWAETDYCSQIQGVYRGTYSDPTHLFPNQAFPLKLFLTYSNGKLYGYTLPSGDQKAVGYGKPPYYLLWGECYHNQISNLYVIKAQSSACGDPTPSVMTLRSARTLDLQFNYENAMINALLKVFVVAISQAEASNPTLLAAAKAKSIQNVPTCH